MRGTEEARYCLDALLWEPDSDDFYYISTFEFKRSTLYCMQNHHASFLSFTLNYQCSPVRENRSSYIHMILFPQLYYIIIVKTGIRDGTGCCTGTAPGRSAYPYAGAGCIIVVDFNRV